MSEQVAVLELRQNQAGVVRLLVRIVKAG